MTHTQQAENAEAPRGSGKLRLAIADRIPDLATAASGYSHCRNYHRLHVWRDGSTTWDESINHSDDIIDQQADHFAAVQSLIVQGTGSCACNCDYCNAVYDADDERRAKDDGRKYNRAEKYQTQEDAIADAFADGDNSGIEDYMIEALDAIPVGYLNDEL